MKERFVRCPYCGMPHEETRAVCPATGQRLERRSAGPSRVPQPPTREMPLSAPSPRVQERPRVPSNHASTSSTSIPIPRRDLMGKTIGGKYVVGEVLGEGGMGTVFSAQHSGIGRQVAIKVLHQNQLRKKDAVKRFHQEARAAAAIGHPNICEVYDLGTLDDGCPYLVMEKLVGETLADRIGNEGGLPVDDVLDVVTQVLSGLVVAHEKGIVHRDIKPENVFLTRRTGLNPVAKLLDFGVSKMIHMQSVEQAFDSEVDLTRTGIVLGTPYYLAPEQARGDRNLDARVDLYAVGVLLYEALTGRRPFTGANYNALLINILTGAPVPVRELRPRLPPGFDEVVEKSIARDRERRYQSAALFQVDLKRLAMHTGTMGTRARSEPLVPIAAPTTPDVSREQKKQLRTTRRGPPASVGSPGAPASRGGAPPPSLARPPTLPPRAAPRPDVRKRIESFDDLPTEVHQPHHYKDFLESTDEVTTLMDRDPESRSSRPDRPPPTPAGGTRSRPKR